MRVSPGKMFPAHVSLGVRLPRTHITWDAYFPRTHFTRDAYLLDCSATLTANVHYINKDQVQVKRTEAMATGVHS